MRSTASPVRVGLVGIGNWAIHGHVRVLQLLPQYEITAVYSQRLDTAQVAATFDDAVRMHTLLDGVLAWSQTGRRTLLAL